MVIMMKQDKQVLRVSVNPNANPNPRQTIGLTPIG